MDNPDIVVGTPSRVLAHLKAGNMVLKDSVEMVVVDEADLVFSFGYETDMKALLTYGLCSVCFLFHFLSVVFSLIF